MSTAATAQGNSQVRVSDAEILRATRLCIDRSGPDRFTMAEVAREAGLTRVQIYNRFGNRDDLVLALLVSHASRFADDLRTTLDAVPSAADAIVQGMMAAIRAAGTDVYFGMLVGPATLARDTRIPGAPEAALQISRQLWVPILQRGKDEGRFDPALVPEDVADWIGLSQLTLFTSTQTFEMPLQQCEAYIRNFIVKPLLAEGQKP